MEQEVLGLNGRERDRLKVLHEAEKGHIRQREAAEQLRLSERQVRRLLARLRKEGDRGLIHQLRGKESKRRIGGAIERRAMGVVAREYAGFGPTLATEYLASDQGLKVSRETVRKWMLQAGLWERRKQRVLEVHVWRPRRSCVGELVQWDTAEQDWLEGRGPRMALVAMLDDASSRALARFVERDTTEENLRLLWTYLERWGRPEAFYTDKDSMFTINRPGKEISGEDEAREEAWTQIGRALKELGDRLDCGALAPGQGASGALLWHRPGPIGEGAAEGWGVHAGGSEPLSGASVLTPVEWPLHGETGEGDGCAPTAAGGARSGRHLEPCGGAGGRPRLYDSLRGAALPDRAQRHRTRTARRHGPSRAEARRSAGNMLSRPLSDDHPVRG